MEAMSCMKAVVVASNKYLSNSCDAHVAELMRQLDEFIIVTAKGSLLSWCDPHQPLPTQCITCLRDILSDTEVISALSQRVMQLLRNLSNEEAICETLHSKFHLTSTLASYLHSCMSASSDTVIIQCVKLLQRITYNCRISSQEFYLDELLKFTIKHIQTKESDLTQPCLGLMANLTRHNFTVQNHVKNMERVKSFYASLVMFMAHSNQTNAISAMTILFSLSPPEAVCPRFFSEFNILQTFQLMFNILLKGESATSRCYSVDLFVDILHQPHIQHSLTMYKHLEPCIAEMLDLLGNVAIDSAAKVFELLLSFCSVSGIRCIICKRLLSDPALQLSKPFAAVVHWASQSEENHSRTSILALEFLKEIYAEMIDLGILGDISPRTELVLPFITEILMKTREATGGFLVRKRCLRVVRAVQLLIALSSEETLRNNVAESIDTKTCTTLIEHQFTHNQISIKQTHNVVDPGDWSEVGVDVVLYTLQLMSKICHLVPNMETSFTQFLQDPVLVPFLAFALTSEVRERVQVALYLVTRGATIDSFPSEVLGESVAAYNTSRTKMADVTDINTESSFLTLPKKLSWSMAPDDKENIPSRGSVVKSENSRADIDSSVDMLIEKMQAGMDLKDSRASEIINVYEHKLLSLQTKEDHLQDLLEAKALALSQADRLISQYRSRRAQSEAEAQKMRALLLESEQQAEEHRDLKVQHDHLKSEYESACSENTRLKVIVEEHNSLLQVYQEQSQQVESLQRNLAKLKQGHQTMTEMHEMLRRHNESLKEQNDVASEQLLELNEKRKSQSELIKKMEAHEKELEKNLSKMKTKLKDQEEMERAVDKLRLSLGKAESERKQLHQRVTSLELVCQQHKEDIQEKERLLRAQQTEIDKHAHIAALIHNLSSGAPPPPKA